MTEIIGKIYNLSLNKRQILRGWYVIISDTGTEYLVERSYSLSSNWYRNVYKIDGTLQDYLVTEEIREQFSRKNNSFYIGIGLVITSFLNIFLRKWLPLNFWFGHFNSTFDMARGAINIVLMILGVTIWSYGLLIYRRIHLQKVFPSLKKIGQIKSLSALIILDNKREFW
ncbi:hypothetical protein [Streptococcus acidominimus]|uniref:Uncharacterized protein n=1 Tax=Streptococcus acidominimus TaxID=1326 RepID=A0A1Q8EEN5_STRAI|nr:hypothetical protein [Streptococcus acidominimus]OLF50252.1 hypothetical protein BU200_03110 [Streptococcus acidominimus]SUN06754.1 Uncharacterised protein [Streptococcus acidominimus]